MTLPADKTPVFSILRLDFYEDPEKIVIHRDPAMAGSYFWGVPQPSCISGTKAYLDREAAQAEAQRLNEVNADKDCWYIVMYARLVDGS